jgi:hypothetical protein
MIDLIESDVFSAGLKPFETDKLAQGFKRVCAD